MSLRSVTGDGQRLPGGRTLIRVRQQIERALDEIRPAVQADGGDIELVSVEAGVVTVKLTGSCPGCPGLPMTLAMVVEPMLKERVPEITRVVAV